MMCLKLHLQEKEKLTKTSKTKSHDKAKRYCQERLVNPNIDDDPRWIDLLRSQFNHSEQNEGNEILDHDTISKEDDLFLTVQNIEFHGDVHKGKRARSCSKYKSTVNSKSHRMFIKETFEEKEQIEEDNLSQLTCYYFDDYVNYLHNSERSRPPSEKSSLLIYKIGDTLMRNRGTQVEVSHNSEKYHRTAKPLNKNFKTSKKIAKKSNHATNAVPSSQNDHDLNESLDDTHISYQKSGKHKSLIISRTQSPETVQVIRVDVVCNQISSPKRLNYENKKLNNVEDDAFNKRLDSVNLRKTHFADKYLLTNTIKALDEKVSSGAKVTLLCKTFRLSDRSSVFREKKTNLKNKAASTSNIKDLS